MFVPLLNLTHTLLNLTANLTVTIKYPSSAIESSASHLFLRGQAVGVARTQNPKASVAVVVAIGNKKAIKLFLPHLIKWQEDHGYPFKFSTEASLNLADDDELLGMMRDANFFALFTGIETPDEATLIQTQKKQNTD